jgi:hypothetical protein
MKNIYRATAEITGYDICNSRDIGEVKIIVMCWKSIFLGIKTGSWFSGKK